MQLAIETLLDGVMRTLREAVLPAVQGRFARGQLFAVLDVLQNLRDRVEPRADLDATEAQSAEVALQAAIASPDGAVPAPPPPPPAARPAPPRRPAGGGGGGAARGGGARVGPAGRSSRRAHGRGAPRDRAASRRAGEARRGHAQALAARGDLERLTMLPSFDDYPVHQTAEP